MAEPLRLFVGLRVGEPARAALAREAGRLARHDDALRPTREHDLHLTLVFVGDGCLGDAWSGSAWSGDARSGEAAPDEVAPGQVSLGEGERRRVEALTRALAPVARRHAPLDVRYVAWGAFPSARAPRVLWAGVEEARPGALARLAADAAEALRPLGLRSEERPFHGHVTLARVRRGARVAPATLECLAQGAQAALGTDRLSVLKIMVSLADPVGYAYNDLTDLPLTGAP